ncbi:MAG TPA: OmpW family outer membrane protein [Woeseiaceae bacterium]|nr:OmpW family outer membrane protein [Woeseiaceae bacterium]
MRGLATRILAVFVGLSFCLALPAQAYEAGDWLVRVGVTTVDPKDENLDVSGLFLEVDDGTTLTFNGTYFFSPNWGVEVLAAAPFNHDIQLESVGKIGETDHLPPTVSLQYHFLPDATFQPYVGLGLNATIFFSEDLNPAVGDDLDLDTSFGLAAQIGADWSLNEKWVLNFEFRWIDIDTEAKVDGASLGDVEIDPITYGINIGYKF